MSRRVTARGLHLHSWECFVVMLPTEWEFRQAPEAADAGVAAFSCFHLLSARSAGTCISLDTGFHCSQKANLEFAVGVEAD